ncbi:hypothetical protein LAZ67_X004341, partial [Cordylochernes scorpioides]
MTRMYLYVDYDIRIILYVDYLLITGQRDNSEKIIKECKKVYTPMELNFQTKQNQENIKVSYLQLIGCLLNAVTTTRPDIIFPVAYLGRTLDKPIQTSWKAAKRIKITVLHGSNAVSWFSKKQGCVSLSTAEAEYVTASVSMQALIHMREVVEEGSSLSFSVILHILSQQLTFPKGIRLETKVLMDSSDNCHRANVHFLGYGPHALPRVSINLLLDIFDKSSLLPVDRRECFFLARRVLNEFVFITEKRFLCSLSHIPESSPKQQVLLCRSPDWFEDPFSLKISIWILLLQHLQ